MDNGFLNINLKGLKVYVVAMLLFIVFFAYSQSIGWRWWFSSGETPPENQQQKGSRYFFHK